MEWTKQALKNLFTIAKEKKLGVAIVIESDMPDVETIINPYVNLEKKLEYIDSAYDDELKLKRNEEIKIVNAALADVNPNKEKGE